MELTIRCGAQEDIGALVQLYDDLNDHLASTINYPGWKKGVYPTLQDAAQGIREGTLHVATWHDEIVGSLILRHSAEPAYLTAPWRASLEESLVFVLYTLVVNPKYLHQGVGKSMLAFADAHARECGVKALRLDVYEKNLPAIRLYEACGFEFVAAVSMGLEHYGLDRFFLYEKLL